MTTRHKIIGTLVMAFALAASTADAQLRDAAAADALFRQGREAMKRGDYGTACPKLAESQRLDPAAGTVLNLAQCEEKQGRFASAQQHYREAIDQLPAGDPRIQVAKAGLASVEGRVPKLIVRLPADGPAGTTVTRDGVELGAVSLGTALPVDPGEHVIRTRAPGRQEAVQNVSAVEGKTAEVTAEIGAASTIGPSTAPDRPSAPTPAEPARTSAQMDTTSASPAKTIGVVAGAVGLIGIGAGTWFAIDTKSKDSDAADACGPNGSNPLACSDKNDAAHQSYTISKWSFIGGGVVLASGIVLVLAAPADEPSAPKVAWLLRTRAAPGNVGVDLEGAW